MTNNGITTMYDKDLCKMYFGQGQDSRLVMGRNKENLLWTWLPKGTSLAWFFFHNPSIRS
jgi:hypothetical protein